MFVLVNLKAYPCDPVAVAEAAAAVAGDTGVRIAVAPQAAHIAAVADAGAAGTLINHSERRRKLADVDGSLRAAVRAGLETVVCANNPRQVAAATALEPDAVAVEPPALIGTSRPVSQADPAVVTDSIEAAGAVGDVPVLCGAGISTGDDLAAAGDLGADGVLLASGVAKADDPRAALASLVDPVA